MPVIPVVKELWVVPNHSRPDYTNIFDATQWPIGVANSTVLQFSLPSFIQFLTAAQQQTAINFCKANKLKFSISFKFVPTYLNGCNSGIEGSLTTQNGFDHTVSTVKSLGGTIDIIDMDEPLYWGHYDSSAGTGACHFPVSTLITEVQNDIARIKQTFPNALVCSTEPTNSVGDDIPTFTQWIQAIKPDLFTFDTNYVASQTNPPWVAQTLNMIKVLDANNVKWGFFPKGIGSTTSDAAWIASAQTNAQTFAKYISEQPHHAVFADWQKFTDHLLPESDPTAAFSLMPWYVSQGGLASTQPPTGSTKPMILVITGTLGSGGGGSTSTVKNLHVYDSTWNSAILSWDSTDSAYHYYDTQYSPDGNTWYNSLINTGATVDAITGLTPGQPGYWFRVRAYTNGIAEPWQQTQSAFVLPARAAATKIEADNKVILSNLSTSALICNLWTNLPGPVTWNVVGLGTVGGTTGFFNGAENGWKTLQTTVTATSPNTAQLTLTSAIDPTVIGFVPIAVTVTNGSGGKYVEKIWIHVVNPTTTATIATALALDTNYHPGQTTTFVIPASLPLGTVVATLVGSGGYFTSNPSGLWDVSWWTENSTTSASNGFLEIEGKATDEARLILINKPPAGSYSITVGVGATQTTDGVAPIGTGKVAPLRQTINFVVLPTATGSVNAGLNHIDNADIIGTGVGQLSSTGLTGTPSYQIMPDFNDRGVQYALTQAGALSVAKILSAGTDTLYGVAYNGLSPTTSSAVWSVVRVPVSWATPTATDSEMVNGQIHIGPTRKYKTRSAFMNTALKQWAPGAHEFYPEPTKNTYAGVELIFDNGPYQNDCTVLDVTGTNVYPDVFEGYLTFPMKLTGDTSVPSSWVRFYSDPEPDIGNSQPGNMRATNSKSYFDVQSYDLILRHCAIDSFAQGEAEYKAINFEAIQAPAKVIIDNCSIGWSDMGILNGEAGKRLIISNSVLAMCGTGDGQTHNFYSGPNDLIIADNVLTFGTQRGHNFKTRSYMGVYKALRSMDGNVGSASFCIDIPNNGAHWLIPGRRATVLQKGPNSENTICVHYGGEINEGHWFNQLTIDGSNGTLIVINDWTPIGSFVGPTYGIVDASNCVQGPQTNITLKNIAFVGVQPAQYTLQTGVGGQAAMTTSGLTAGTRPAILDFTLPFTNGMTKLPINDRNTYVWNVMMENIPQIQQGVYLASDIIAENQISIPASSPAGTAVCSPVVRSKSAVDPQTWITGGSGYPAGTTVITMWEHPPIGAALSPAPGAQFPANGLAPGTTVTNVDTSFNITISPPTTGQIYFGDVVSYSGPLTMTGAPRISVTDSLGVLGFSGANIVYNGGASAGQITTGVVTAAPAGTVNVQTGSGLAPLPTANGQRRFTVAFS